MPAALCVGTAGGCEACTRDHDCDAAAFCAWHLLANSADSASLVPGERGVSEREADARRRAADEGRPGHCLSREVVACDHDAYNSWNGGLLCDANATRREYFVNVLPNMTQELLDGMGMMAAFTSHQATSSVRLACSHRGVCLPSCVRQRLVPPLTEDEAVAATQEVVDVVVHPEFPERDLLNTTWLASGEWAPDAVWRHLNASGVCDGLLLDWAHTEGLSEGMDVFASSCGNLRTDGTLGPSESEGVRRSALWVRGCRDGTVDRAPVRPETCGVDCACCVEEVCAADGVCNAGVDASIIGSMIQALAGTKVVDGVKVQDWEEPWCSQPTTLTSRAWRNSGACYGAEELCHLPTGTCLTESVVDGLCGFVDVVGSNDCLERVPNATVDASGVWRTWFRQRSDDWLLVEDLTNGLRRFYRNGVANVMGPKGTCECHAPLVCDAGVCRTRSGLDVDGREPPSTPRGDGCVVSTGDEHRVCEQMDADLADCESYCPDAATEDAWSVAEDVQPRCFDACDARCQPSPLHSARTNEAREARFCECVRDGCQETTCSAQDWDVLNRTTLLSTCPGVQVNTSRVSCASAPEDQWEDVWGRCLDWYRRKWEQAAALVEDHVYARCARSCGDGRNWSHWLSDNRTCEDAKVALRDDGCASTCSHELKAGIVGAVTAGWPRFFVSECYDQVSGYLELPDLGGPSCATRTTTHTHCAWDDDVLSYLERQGIDPPPGPPGVVTVDRIGARSWSMQTVGTTTGTDCRSEKSGDAQVVCCREERVEGALLGQCTATDPQSGRCLTPRPSETEITVDAVPSLLGSNGVPRRTTRRVAKTGTVATLSWAKQRCEGLGGGWRLCGLDEWRACAPEPSCHVRSAWTSEPCASDTLCASEGGVAACERSYELKTPFESATTQLCQREGSRCVPRLNALRFYGATDAPRFHVYVRQHSPPRRLDRNLTVAERFAFGEAATRLEDGPNGLRRWERRDGDVLALRSLDDGWFRYENVRFPALLHALPWANCTSQGAAYAPLGACAEEAARPLWPMRAMGTPEEPLSSTRGWTPATTPLAAWWSRRVGRTPNAPGRHPPEARTTSTATARTWLPSWWRRIHARPSCPRASSTRAGSRASTRCRRRSTTSWRAFAATGRG